MGCDTSYWFFVGSFIFYFLLQLVNAVNKWLELKRGSFLDGGHNFDPLLQIDSEIVAVVEC